MKKRVYIFINGIKNDPSDAENWTDRAVTWTHINTNYRGEKFEYKAGTLTRRFKQQSRAGSLVTMISYYLNKKWDVVLVGHSNGCDIIMRALILLNGQRVREVHLISGACEADAEKNGLLEQVKCGAIGALYLYIAGEDKAMKSAAFSQKAVGWLGLGYGTLGGMDPDEARKVYGKDAVMYKAGFGHSTWFEKGTLFEITMQQIMYGMPAGGKA
jgi:hypothetical protein